MRGCASPGARIFDALRVDPEVASGGRRGGAPSRALGATVEEVRARFADTSEMIRLHLGRAPAASTATYLREWRDRMDPGLGRRTSEDDYR